MTDEKTNAEPSGASGGYARLNNKETNMGSSYSSDLRSGRMPECESRLRQALTLIESVAADFSDLIGDTGQFDDAAEDGCTCEALRRAADEIRSLIPLTEKEREEKIARLERLLAFLKGHNTQDDWPAKEGPRHDERR